MVAAGVPAAVHPPLPARRAGLVGLTAATLGTLAVVLASTTLAWFGDGDLAGASDGSRYFDVHDVLARIRAESDGALRANTVAVQYFTWLSWTLLVLVLVCAVVACLPSARSELFRVVGAGVGLVAVGATFLAIDLISVTDSRLAARAGDQLAYSDFLSHAGPAFYAAVAGFTLLGAGAALGSRRA